MKKNISRERILKKAMALLKEKGFSGLSVNNIVEYAKVAKGTFYIYFENKEDLICEIFDYYFEAFQQEVIDPTENNDMRAFSERLVRFFSERKEFLLEIREVILLEEHLPVVNKTLAFIDISFDQVLILKDLRENLNMKIYQRVLANMIVDVCYRAIIEENEFDTGAAVDIITDILDRFFVFHLNELEREA